MNHREVMQQALEALELHAEQYPHMQKGYTIDAITALRNALAEPTEFVCSTGLCSYRRPLTDEEIDRVIERHASGSDWSDAEYESAVSFARAIERAHGIKQEEA